MAINKIDLLSPGFVYRKSFCFLHRLLLYNFWWPPIFYRFYIEETFSTINSSTTSKKKTLFGNRCFKLDLSKYIFLTLIFNLWKRIYSFFHVMKCFQKFSSIGQDQSGWSKDLTTGDVHFENQAHKIIMNNNSLGRFASFDGILNGTPSHSLWTIIMVFPVSFIGNFYFLKFHFVLIIP